jgi:ectoine hydroxylase
MIALDRANKENGCLQILKGSHHMGRVDHGWVGKQFGANTDRIEEIKKVTELLYVEMEPGDALFFHCNLLHKSDANLSKNSRWCMISCYNTASNNPFKEHHHPRYTPLSKLPNSAILEMNGQLSATRKGWWTDEENVTLRENTDKNANLPVFQ